ncbi:MAG: hypothetical protein SFX74_12475 [Fimbriimonadaceae bacterium]|nr:hypothetical protein [Fimbriimonadaceae bacterium]
MKQVATTLLIGIAIGAIGAVMIKRLREVIADGDPDALVDRITHQVEDLERKLVESTALPVTTA